MRLYMYDVGSHFASTRLDKPSDRCEVVWAMSGLQKSPLEQPQDTPGGVRC